MQPEIVTGNCFQLQPGVATSTRSTPFLSTLDREVAICDFATKN
jgi:hypothetical protein